MLHSKLEVLAVGGLLLLAGVGVYKFKAGRSQPRITVEKVSDQTGGMYSINGSGYEASEMVSLEIKNAPLTQPSGWHLGNVSAVGGKFSFKTEDFHCVRVDDARLREQYKQQRVIFVATGLRSGHAATAVDTAGEILMCP